MKALSLSVCCLLTIWCMPAFAASEFVLECEGEEVSGWSFYCEPPAPEPEEIEEEKPAPMLAPPPAPMQEEEKYPSTAKMMEFRAMVEDIKHKAVLDPTPENVLAYMEVNKLMADKAGEFTDVWQRVLFETPRLDANVDFPLAQAGIGVYQDQMRVIQEETFKKVAQTAGILFVFEDDAKCGMCKKQGEVLKGIEKMHGISILAVSRDGGQNEHYPEAMIDNGRLEELGMSSDEFPVPTMALVDPKTGQLEMIGSGILTADLLLERVYVITQIPVGERY